MGPAAVFMEMGPAAMFMETARQDQMQAMFMEMGPAAGNIFHWLAFYTHQTFLVKFGSDPVVYI